MTASNGPEKKGLDRFTKDVLYSALVGLTAQALGAAALALAALAIGLILTGWSVPAWTLAAMALLAIVLVYLTRRASGREAREMQPKLDKVKADLEAVEEKLDRHDSYGTNICSIMDNFQRVLAGDMPKVSVAGFIERGILHAGRDVMQENGHAADLRMSVLLADGSDFTMWKASGHNLQSQQKYRQPIDKTVSKIAFEKKGMQTWKDVTEEERGFHQNPHATRKFRAMVSIPLLIGDKAVGVFNIVTEKADAFDAADINYLTSLGAVVQTAVGVAVKVAKQEEEKLKALPKPVKAVPTPLKESRRLRRITPKSTPSSGVQSGESSTGGMEASDD